MDYNLYWLSFRGAKVTCSTRGLENLLCACEKPVNPAPGAPSLPEFWCPWVSGSSERALRYLILYLCALTLMVP